VCALCYTTGNDFAGKVKSKVPLVRKPVCKFVASLRWKEGVFSFLRDVKLPAEEGWEFFIGKKNKRRKIC